jgi:putative phosphoribosyl transferase
MTFLDRSDAGRRLGTRLAHLRERHPVVVGLPRGGVPVAAAVARALDAPLDVIVVRKLGVPYQPELAMGAVGEGAVTVVNESVRSTVAAAAFEEVKQRELAEVETRLQRFRQGRPPVPLAGRVVIVVDDGIATGSTARAACEVARAHGAARVVLATPVAPLGWDARLSDSADELVALMTPDPFFAVGQFYDDFSPTTDEEVALILSEHSGAERRDPDPTTRASLEVDQVQYHPITVTAGEAVVEGDLNLPAHASGLVIFAHGSGSSRHSPRNRMVAEVLNRSGLATLLFDLLTEAEAVDRSNVFDVELLADRLRLAHAQVCRKPPLEALPVGYFGASTGAAAALWAAADDRVKAVVSRGGRPDLAGERLGIVRAPTLLIAGSQDTTVLELNGQAQRRMRCPTRLAVVPGATHVFEEPGTLTTAAELARDWFCAYLPPRRADDRPAVS